MRASGFFRISAFGFARGLRLSGFLQGDPALLADCMGWPGKGILHLIRRKALGGGAKGFFEFATQVGLAGEFQFRGDDLVGMALNNELFGKLTLQVSKPATRSAMEVLLEKTLQLALGYGTERSHFDRIEIRLPCDLLPFFHREQVAIHIAPHC